MKRVFVGAILGTLANFFAVSAGFPENGQGLAAVDRALFASLQNLKNSMRSVDQAGMALRQENDFLKQRIEAIKGALGRSEEQKQIQAEWKLDAAASEEEKSKRLTEQIQLRKAEEYQALNGQYEDLLRRIRAKEESLVDIQRTAKMLAEEIASLEDQAAAVDEFFVDPLENEIMNLEKSFRESRKDQKMLERQKELFDLKPEAVATLSEAEVANKKLWLEMQRLEAELKDLSGKWAQAGRDQSARKKDQADIMAGLDAEVQALDQQLEFIEADIKSVPVLPAVEAMDDQALRNYRFELERKNQALRSQAESLRNFLPDL